MVTFTDPSDWVLTELDEQGAGLPDPQFLIANVNEAVDPAVTVVGVTVAE
jgi:hypothetical protein